MSAREHERPGSHCCYLCRAPRQHAIADETACCRIAAAVSVSERECDALCLVEMPVSRPSFFFWSAQQVQDVTEWILTCARL